MALTDYVIRGGPGRLLGAPPLSGPDMSEQDVWCFWRLSRTRAEFTGLSYSARDVPGRIDEHLANLYAARRALDDLPFSARADAAGAIDREIRLVERRCCGIVWC